MSLQTAGTCEYTFLIKATDERPGLFVNWVVGMLGYMLVWVDRIRSEAEAAVEYALAPSIYVIGPPVACVEYGVRSFAETDGTTLPRGVYDFPVMSIGPTDEFPAHLKRFDEDLWNLAGHDIQRTAPTFFLTPA